MQKMIDEERAATKSRYRDKGADAMILAGLYGLSARKPGMQGFFEGAARGMEHYDKASELEAAANAKSRQAQMELLKSRMADEKGDRKAAQEHLDSYQRNLRESETYELARTNLLLGAQRSSVEMEGKRDRAAATLTGLADKIDSQSIIAEKMHQVRLSQLQLAGERAAAAAANAANKNAPKLPTVSDLAQLKKIVDDDFSRPNSDVFRRFVGAAAAKSGINAAQFLADLNLNKFKPGTKEFTDQQNIISGGRDLYLNYLASLTRSPLPMMSQ
jgi:hypothetical protein